MRVITGWEAAERMHDRLLARARTGPPKKRKRPGPPQPRASIESISSINSGPVDTTAAWAGQRAIQAANLRAQDLDRRSRLLTAIGLRDAALRTAVIAERIRAEVLA